MSKYQQSSPEEVQSEQREEQQIGRTLGGFWGSGRGSPLDDGKWFREMKGEGEEGRRKTRGALRAQQKQQTEHGN